MKLSVKKFKAFIFDLDGVVTKTATVHARAWKQMFDEFLKKHLLAAHFTPFDEESDYLNYVDGKPRDEGIRSFLQSRNIEIPSGLPNDDPNKETIYGLGNKKNALFLEELNRSGIEVFTSTISLIQQLKGAGLKVALITSSKNCVPILQKTNLLSLFDVKIDGIDAQNLGLKGKPAPDVFLEAAKLLNVSPKETVVVEDAISGVEAGRRGGFEMVIGVNRADQAEALAKGGAHLVVNDLSEIEIENGHEKKNALSAKKEIFTRIKDKQLVIFLDFDGTLTPIVRHANLAHLSPTMRHTLEELSRHFTTSVISGRNLADVEKRVGIDTVFYAGNHGFDIAGPKGMHFENREAELFFPILYQAVEQLEPKISAIPGAWVEHKRYSIAIHYREVSPEREKEVEKIVNDVYRHFPALKKTYGKKVFELQPNINWDKGKALLWLLDKFGLNRPNVIPLFIGDDLTDEDGFSAISTMGIGIAVQENLKPTAAHYTLKNPEEVQQFLNSLVEEKSLVAH